VRTALLIPFAATFAACSVLYPLDDMSRDADDPDVPALVDPRDAGDGEAPEASEAREAAVETGRAAIEPDCVGPQESEPNDEPSAADPLPASTTVCGMFDGDPDVFAFEHGDFGTIEISIDAPEQLEVTAVIGGMTYDAHPNDGSIVAPIVKEGTAIITVRRGAAPVGKHVRYELTRTGP
jgi:hypothetical protein